MTNEWNMIVRQRWNEQGRYSIWRKNTEKCHEIYSICFRNVYCLARIAVWTLIRKWKRTTALYENHCVLKPILLSNCILYSYGISKRFFPFSSPLESNLFRIHSLIFFPFHWFNIYWCTNRIVFGSINQSLASYEIRCAHEKV